MAPIARLKKSQRRSLLTALEKKQRVTTTKDLEIMHDTSDITLIPKAAVALPDKAEDTSAADVFSWQLSQLLGNVTVKYHKQAPLESCFRAVKQVVDSMQDFSETPVVRIVGSYMTKAVCKSRSDGINADIAVAMPGSLFQDKDQLNCRYFEKRSAFLAAVRGALESASAFKDCLFEDSLLNGDQRKPIVLIKSPDFKFTVRILPCAHAEAFKQCRLAPDRNNLRPYWLENREPDAVVDPALLTPTPHYNNSILVDCHLISHFLYMYQVSQQSPQTFSEVVILLKVWLKQRGMDAGNGGVNGFLMTMIFCHLVIGGTISLSWSTQQIFRVFIEWLCRSDLHRAPLCMSKEGGYPVEFFKNAFQVCVVDPSGLVNLASGCTVSDMLWLQHQATLTFACLTDSLMDRFDVVFLKDLVNVGSFDNLFSFSLSQEQCDALVGKHHAADHGSSTAAFRPYLIDLLHRGLGDRVQQIHVVVDQDNSEYVLVSVGLLVNVDQVCKSLDMGPAGDDLAALAEFRKLWGDKAEMRRFPDGSIRYAVYWDISSEAAYDQRSTILEHIVSYLMRSHLSVQDLSYSGNQLFPFLRTEVLDAKVPSLGQTCASFKTVMLAFDSFSKLMKDLNDVPLALIDVRPAHAALRYSTVLIPQKRKPSPFQKGYLAFTDAIDVVLHMEGSSRWPQDLAAIQKTRASFYCSIAKAVTKKGLHANVVKGDEEDSSGLESAGHVDVYSDGYVFRCRISCEVELALLQRSVTQQPELKPAMESYKRKMINDPHHTLKMQALAHRFPSLSSAIRILKRWTRSHMLNFPDEVLELICVFVYSTESGYGVPGTPWSGFVRTLELLCTWNWLKFPLIVLLEQGALTRQKRDLINAQFEAARKNDPLYTKACMYIVPILSEVGEQNIALGAEWTSPVWSVNAPNTLELQRIVQTARSALRYLESFDGENLKPLFTHATGAYDVIIHCKKEYCFRNYESIKPPVSQIKGAMRETFKNTSEHTARSIMAVDFDPVAFYLRDLRACFEGIAMFFSDVHDGSVIGVAFNPEVLNGTRPFKKNLRYTFDMVADPASKHQKVKLNLDAVLQQMAILGVGLVDSIEVQMVNEHE